MNQQNNKGMCDRSDLGLLEPDYGTGMRKLRGLFDYSQKEAAAILGMTQQQLSQLEKKKQWTDEMLQRVSNAFNIPQAGLDNLATRNDLISYIIQGTTLADNSILMNNGNISHTYHIGDTAKAEEIISKIENLIVKLDKNSESLKKVMPRQNG